MLYVSKHDKKKGLYGVTDTDDGTTEFRSKDAVLRAYHVILSSGGTIHGVDGKNVHVYNPTTGEISVGGDVLPEKSFRANYGKKRQPSPDVVSKAPFRARYGK